MIETDFFILDQEQFDYYSQFADKHGVSLDYYLSEFCQVEGEDVCCE